MLVRGRHRDFPVRGWIHDDRLPAKSDRILTIRFRRKHGHHGLRIAMDERPQRGQTKAVAQAALMNAVEPGRAGGEQLTIGGTENPPQIAPIQQSQIGLPSRGDGTNVG